MRRKALEIAEEHFRRVNPSMWEGDGEQPADFNNRRITYSINRYTELDVSFEQDRAGNWKHCCKLRDTLTDNLLAVQYAPGINSPQSLTTTILEICKEIGGTPSFTRTEQEEGGKPKMKIGDFVYTPRFCTVQIKAVFATEIEAYAAGYCEPTYYQGDHVILGKVLDMYHMEFAAVPKGARHE